MSSIMGMINKWFPQSPNIDVWRARLNEFYARSEEYHAMTRSGDKTTHPHVNFLSHLIHADETYAEIGCGGGAVCGMVGEISNVYGFDISPIAIEHAKKNYGSGLAHFEVASGDHIAMADESVDGVYSFEVLEHVWDIEAVIGEMIRVVKPGGFILVSTPNWFSLDLHLNKNRLVRWCEVALAGVRYIYDMITRKVSCNLVPDIEGEIYPDCDMVSSVIAQNLPKYFQRLGCEVKFCDTFYMCAHREGSNTSLDFQRNSSRPFIQHFGDHLLLLAYKNK